jgi:hypothetical protein
MKFTITNNGTQPLSVLYTDLFKIYAESDEGVVGDVVTLEPDTSVTLDNVEAVHQITPGNLTPDDFEYGGEGLEDLTIDDDEDDEDEEDEEDENLLSQEDFDNNERDS